MTGRKEDVGAAKREILSAAEHFSQIRASRRNNSVSGGSVTGTSPTSSTLTPGPPSPNAPGQVTKQVRVPYRVVGLVVGPKGSTIKRIQQQTHTYIVTPSRDKEPVFEVTGLPENVEMARKEIESHIAMRTGGMVDSGGNHEDCHNDFHSNGIDSGFHELNGDIMSSLYSKPPPNNSTNGSNGFCTPFSVNNSNNLGCRSSRNNHLSEPTIFNFPPVNGCSTTSTANKLSSEFSPLTSNGFTPFGNGFSIYDNDEGIGSPSFDPIPPSPSVWADVGDNRNNLVSLFGTTSVVGTLSGSTVNSSLPRRSSSLGTTSTPRLSPTLTDSNGYSPPSNNGSTAASDHVMVRRIRSDPLTNHLCSISSAFTPLNPSNVFCTVTTAPLSSGIGTISNTNGYISSTCSDSSTSSNGGCSPPPTATPPNCVQPLGVAASPPDSNEGSPTRVRRNCLICSDSEVVAALVPCGHNLFCMECANEIVEKPIDERHCPACTLTPTQAIRIFS